MAHISVSATRLSRKDIASLAHIIEINLEHFCKYSSPMEKDYLRELKTVVGLGFTAAMVDNSLVTIYRDRLNTFLAYCDFTQHPGALQLLCQTVAEMIELSIRLFDYINYPQYYRAFLTSTNRILNNVTSDLAGESREAARLITIITNK